MHIKIFSTLKIYFEQFLVLDKVEGFSTRDELLKTFVVCCFSTKKFVNRDWPNLSSPICPCFLTLLTQR